MSTVNNDSNGGASSSSTDGPVLEQPINIVDLIGVPTLMQRAVERTATVR